MRLKTSRELSEIRPGKRRRHSHHGGKDQRQGSNGITAGRIERIAPRFQDERNERDVSFQGETDDET